MTTLTDQLAQRIQFFEASAQAKDKIMKRYEKTLPSSKARAMMWIPAFFSEAERLKLEIELNKLTNSDQAM